MSKQGPLAGPNPASGPYINHHMSSYFINVYSLSHCPLRLSGCKLILIFCVTIMLLQSLGPDFQSLAQLIHSTLCVMRALFHETSQAVALNVLAVSQVKCSVQSEECLELSSCLQVVGLTEALVLECSPFYPAVFLSSKDTLCYMLALHLWHSWVFGIWYFDIYSLGCLKLFVILLTCRTLLPQ